MRVEASFEHRAKIKNIQVGPTKMSYVEAGQGDPILLLHGNPTWSYLWRNVMPHLASCGRCIAPDLPGMGRSEKPNISYRFNDHYRYIKGFIDALDLKNITLVLHDWGSALGFHYAAEHPENIQGIAFMEALVRPWRWKHLKPAYRLGFWLLRLPLTGEILIYGFNVFLNVIMPRLIVRKLSREEKSNYKAPFRKRHHRKPMLVWPREIPINGKPASTYRIISGYSKYFAKASFPKLMLYADPGAILEHHTVEWCRRNITNLEAQYIGKGKHFLQEDHPHTIGQYLRQWYQRCKNTN